ncbi:MAG: Ig-like domain-containing protein [Spirochaetia bacterium]|jgi:hypothetical protein
MKNLIRLCAAALIIAALMVCSNPIDIVGNVTNEVKASHNLFLVVSNVSPAANSTVSPGSAIAIKFDRSIDPSTATSATITFTPAIAWDSSSYDDPSKTLTIVPAMLEGGKSYTVSVTTGVKGTDGSTVQSSYTWTFSTKAEPYGTFKITSPDTTPAHDPAYTNNQAVTIVVTPNQLVYKMHIYQDGGTDMGWMVTALTSVPFTLSTGDGLKTMWIQFVDEAGTFFTTPISHTITLDKTPPTATSLTISGSGGVGLTNSTNVNLTYVGSDANGLYQMQFYNGTYSGWLAYAASYTYSIPSGDGVKTVYVQFGDKAGNQSGWVSSTITLDTVPPNAPTVTGTPSPGTALPTFTWASGGGGGAGYYRYGLNSVSAWSAETTATSLAPSIDYGSNYLYVEERDAAYNWSTYGYASYFYYPSWLRPVYQATGVSRTPLLVFGTGRYLRTYWDLYAGTNPKKLDLYVQNLTAYSYQVPTALPASTTIYWRYKMKNSTEGPVTYTSPVYYFTTGS